MKTTHYRLETKDYIYECGDHCCTEYGEDINIFDDELGIHVGLISSPDGQSKISLITEALSLIKLYEKG